MSVTSSTQDAVDYGNEAQQRIAADTRVLIKRTTLTVLGDTATYALSSDVIALRSIQDSTGCELVQLRILDVLQEMSLTPDSAPQLYNLTGYYTVGTTIGFIPTPAAAATYTIFYEARPAPFTSDVSLELQGDHERLVDILTQQMKLSDDGQPELAAAELAYYQVEMPRLRRRPYRAQPDQIQLPKRRRR